MISLIDALTSAVDGGEDDETYDNSLNSMIEDIERLGFDAIETTLGGQGVLIHASIEPSS